MNWTKVLRLATYLVRDSRFHTTANQTLPVLLERYGACVLGAAPLEDAMFDPAGQRFRKEDFALGHGIRDKSIIARSKNGLTEVRHWLDREPFRTEIRQQPKKIVSEPSERGARRERADLPVEFEIEPVFGRAISLQSAHGCATLLHAALRAFF